MTGPADTAKLRAHCVDAHRAGHHEEARGLYATYLAQVPGDGGMWSNLGALFRTTHRYDLSLRAQRRAIALDPIGVGVRNNLANILSDMGQYEESIALRRDILRETPDDVNQQSMIGRCLRGMGRYDEAVAWLADVVAAHPDAHEPQIQLAFAQFGAGDFANGFVAYRARWQSDELTPHLLPYEQWEGQDLTGKTILVMPEQGHGDTILCARFLPHLKDLGARVILRSDKPLARVMAEVPGTDISGTSIPMTEYVHYWMNMMDLPMIRTRTIADVPPPARLSVPQDSVDRAKAIVAPHKAAFKVGVVWSGSLTYRANGFRSFHHREFLPLTDIEGVQLFSLYKGDALDEFHADGSSAFIIDTASTDRDFADCAATMQQMDLIITSDTATGHLAGSLGLPVWVVLHWDAFWVYRHSGDTTPWYPTARLYRQQVPRDWSHPFAQIRSDLTALAARHRP